MSAPEAGETRTAADLTRSLTAGHEQAGKAQDRAVALRRSAIRTTVVNMLAATVVAGGNWGRLPLWSQLTFLLLSLVTGAVTVALVRAARGAARTGTPRSVKRLGRVMLAAVLATQGALLATVALAVMVS